MPAATGGLGFGAPAASNGFGISAFGMTTRAAGRFGSIPAATEGFKFSASMATTAFGAPASNGYGSAGYDFTATSNAFGTLAPVRLLKRLCHCNLNQPRFSRLSPKPDMYHCHCHGRFSPADQRSKLVQKIHKSLPSSLLQHLFIIFISLPS